MITIRVLIKGAGDLATGVAAALYRCGHQIVMTEIARPLTVRRSVAMSQAVYDRTAQVEGILGVLAHDYKEAEHILTKGNVAVIVDEKACIRKEYKPDVLVDAILAKKNTGTKITDAAIVIGLGPGFTAGCDCHAVIETKRGESLGKVLYEGKALPNTGVPGYVAGYAAERLLKASADGRMEPVAQIGDMVKKGQIVAYTGEKPVMAEVDGIVRGMLMEDLTVTKGLKIGDIDPRKKKELCEHISDKANIIGNSVKKVIEDTKIKI